MSTARSLHCSLLSTAILLVAAAAGSATETWNFDVTTTGNDVFWDSPTAVDPGAAVYSTTFELTLIEVDVTWQSIPFNNIDVTDQVPPEFQSGAESLAGPAPFDLVNSTIVFPDPPEPPALEADLVIAVDAAGFGSVSATNVSLGTLDLDLGIFGVQTVNLVSVRIVGSVTVHATWFDLGAGLAGTAGVPLLPSQRPGDPDPRLLDPESPVQGRNPGAEPGLLLHRPADGRRGPAPARHHLAPRSPRGLQRVLPVLDPGSGRSPEPRGEQCPRGREPLTRARVRTPVRGDPRR
jgi:hypothetical protein